MQYVLKQLRHSIVDLHVLPLNCLSGGASVPESCLMGTKVHFLVAQLGASFLSLEETASQALAHQEHQ